MYKGHFNLVNKQLFQEKRPLANVCIQLTSDHCLQVMDHNTPCMFWCLISMIVLLYMIISGNSSSVKVQKLEKLFTVRLRAHQRQSCAVK